MAQSSEYAVVARDIRKSYIARGADRRKNIKSRDITVEALKGVSFAAPSGESIGILGQNGSGKSTLLRLIAGGETPTSGSLLVRSQPVLLGISAALQPTLSGARNVRLGCLAMGMTPEQVDEVYDDIVSLSGLDEDAMARPMQTYSAGMGSRLRFAIATSIDPDILLIDEALSAGDAAFATRAKRRMDHLLTKAHSIFLVSHAAQTIEEMCTRAIWLHKGEIIADGPAESTARHYRLWAWREAKDEYESANKIIEDVKKDYVKPNIVLASDEKNHNGKRH
ncbi:MAG: ABC transporter ATP-binding protein [Flaviflexus sp.]|uniref:ABC transporter ATP-binding protein n=1 Tax=Flaviflexus sp. TaxID=1969482 RepID=UPI003F906218